MVTRSPFTLFAGACLLFSVFALNACNDGANTAVPPSNSTSSQEVRVAVPRDEEVFRILTWNLQWFPGQSPSASTPQKSESHYQEVLSVLAEADADIICLQEIKDPKAFSRLSNDLGCSFEVLSEFRGAQEIGITARIPAEVVAFEEFEKAENTPPRGFAFALFDLPDTRLLVYTVHLKSNVGGISANIGKREESARQLLDHVRYMEKEYEGDEKPLTVVLCGDFNTNPYDPDFAEEQTLQILKEAGFEWAFEGVPREDATTWLSDGRYPNACFDHFFVKGRDSELNRATALVTERDISDHRPVVWSLTVSGIH